MTLVMPSPCAGVAALAMAIVASTPVCAYAAEGIPAECSKIDIESTQRVVSALMSKDPPTVDAAAAQIVASPGNFGPSAFYSYAYMLVQNREIAAGLRWYLFADLRSIRDVGVTWDKAAVVGHAGKLSNAVSDVVYRAAMRGLDAGQLHSKVPPLSPEEIQAIGDEVLELDRTTPFAYDRRWLAYYGTACRQGKSVNPGPTLLVPESEYEARGVETRDWYTKRIASIVALYRTELEKRAAADSVKTEKQPTPP